VDVSGGDIGTIRSYIRKRNEMKNLITAALLLTACTEHVATDAEVHERVTCDSDWSGHNGVVSREYCEAACESFGQLGTNFDCRYNGGMSCQAGHRSNFEGREGCCVMGDEAAGYAMTFVDCE
jgi:hypothetical protein